MARIFHFCIQNNVPQDTTVVLSTDIEISHQKHYLFQFNHDHHDMIL